MDKGLSKDITAQERKRWTNLLIRLAIVGIAVANSIQFGLDPAMDKMNQDMTKDLPAAGFFLIPLVMFLWFGFGSYWVLVLNWRMEQNRNSEPAFRFLFPFGGFFRKLRERRQLKHPANWERPTWYTNPFSGPLQFWHLGAFFFSGFGLPALLIRAAMGKSSFFGAFALGGGLGVYCGYRYFMKRQDGPWRESKI